MTAPSGEQRSFLDAAMLVLAEAEGPLNAEEITSRALARRLVRTAGKTPSVTMAARLYQDINRLGVQSRFVKVSAGQFALRSATSPGASTGPGNDRTPRSRSATPVVSIAASGSDALIRELLTAQTDSKNPARFEQAVRDAFDVLGFEATRLGGSGETDVYLVARAGAELYRVVVDAKSSGNARVTEGQINWVSVRDHRTHREAHHVLVVAPGFAGGNLLTRASEYQVALLQAQDLAEVVRWHAETPFSLPDLRPLFEGPGHVTQALDDLKRLHETTTRQWALLPEIVQAYSELGDVHPDVAGVYLYLRGRQSTKTLWQETVEHAIGMLASPLLGILRPHNSGGGYALTMRPETAHRRLRAMTRAAAGMEQNPPVLEAGIAEEQASYSVSTRGKELTQVTSPISEISTSPDFAALQANVVHKMEACGLSAPRVVSKRHVILRHGRRTVGLAFRTSKCYPGRRWWWTFTKSSDEAVLAECDSIVLVGLMADPESESAVRDELIFVTWGDAAALAARGKATAWTAHGRIHVYVGDGGPWESWVLPLSELRPI